MSHVMIDSETLGTGSFPVILSIGAIKFELDAPPVEPDNLALTARHMGNSAAVFFEYVKLDSCFKAGASINNSTLTWWLDDKQTDARKFAFGHDNIAVPLANMLWDLHDFTKGAEGLWSHGATFDISILSRA